MTSMSRPGRGRSSGRRSSFTETDWDGYVPVKVKSFWSLALCGTTSHQLPGLLCSEAVGVIRIVGGRTGQKLTSLWVGFSRSEHLPAPRFALEDEDAVGTLVLPEACFAPWLEVLKSSRAFFQIGGDGHGNALASEMNLLQSSPA